MNAYQTKPQTCTKETYHTYYDEDAQTFYVYIRVTGYTSIDGYWSPNYGEVLQECIFTIHRRHIDIYGPGVFCLPREVFAQVSEAYGFDTPNNPASLSLYDGIRNRLEYEARQRDHQKKLDQYNLPEARIRRQLPTASPEEMKYLLEDVPRALLVEMADELEAIVVPSLEDE